MQHFPVQSSHIGSVRALPQPLPAPIPFISPILASPLSSAPAQHYQLVEVAHPLLPQGQTLLSPNVSGQTIYQQLPSPNGGAILVPIQSAGQQVLISQEVVTPHIPLQLPLTLTGAPLQYQADLGAHLQHQQLSHNSHLNGTTTSPLQHNNTVHTNVQIAPTPLLPQQTLLVHSSPTGHLQQPQQSHHPHQISLPQSSPPQPAQQQPQQQFLVVNDVVNGTEVVEFTDAGTQTILSALSQGETPAISINGDIVGYVNCAEIKSDGAIVFTIGGATQPKSEISNFLELIDKKQSQRDAQSWFFDSVVATQAMQALISKRPDIKPTVTTTSGIRRQVH